MSWRERWKYIRQDTPGIIGILIAVAILLLWATGILASDPDARARVALALASQAPRPPQAPPLKPYCLCWHAGEDCSCGVCTCPLGYDRLYARAVAEGKPFVVWVGVPGHAVPGAYCVSVDTLEGVSGPCCLVGVPGSGGWIQQRARLSCHATPAEVRGALAPTAPQTHAVPPMQFAPVMRSAPARGGRGAGC